MYGAILGDIIGSPYEFDRGGKTKEFPLFSQNSMFTDDSVMTLAIANGIMITKDKRNFAELKKNMTKSMLEFGRCYPYVGYGVMFDEWLRSDDPKPYGSYGNGSAMRVSPVAWIYDSIELVRKVARISAEITHDHPEGIKGAEATASAIFLARTGSKKEEIKAYIEKEFQYDLSRTCDEIRPVFRHIEICQKTVHEAIIAFLEGQSFEDVIRTAVSLGGDTDTVAAIAGSIAEAYYGIDEDWKKAAYHYLTPDLGQILCYFDVHYGVDYTCQINPLHKAIRFAEKAHRGQKRKGSEVDYIVHPMEVFQILTSMKGSYELLIAGLLHDTVEDCDVTLVDIYRIFGDRVGYLVGQCSEDKEKSWKERKQHTIDLLKTADRDTKMLILADKVANLRCIMADRAEVGEKVWDRFCQPKEMQAWYYSEIQDQMFELQNDTDVKLFYWEMVDLYKDLFVEFYIDFKEQHIYQLSCGTESFLYRADAGIWEKYEGDLPENAVKVPRIKAERIEDFWRNENPGPLCKTKQ